MAETSVVRGIEGSIKAYDPLAYWVDVVSSMDPKIVRTHREKDAARKKELLAGNKGDYDVFICVDKEHAFILCVPHSPIDDGHPLKGAFSEDPFQIPELLLCWTFELCFQNAEQRLYRIRKVFDYFKEIRPRITQSFFIGQYTEVCPNAFQFAVLSAAPHRYNAIINDCVEFSKEFCLCLLNYCANWKQLEKEVNRRIKDVSATGLSVERLSRRVRSSGLIGYSLLTGLDTSNLFGGRHSTLRIVLVFFFLLVYPIIVAVVVKLL